MMGQKSWTAHREIRGAHQLAVVTQSGWTNSFVTLRWLEEAFDPFTRERAGGGRQRRLLFLDGADAHTKVDFLEACWARNIVCVMLPAHLTGIF